MIQPELFQSLHLLHGKEPSHQRLLHAIWHPLFMLLACCVLTRERSSTTTIYKCYGKQLERWNLPAPFGAAASSTPIPCSNCSFLQWDARYSFLRDVLLGQMAPEIHVSPQNETFNCAAASLLRLPHIIVPPQTSDTTMSSVTAPGVAIQVSRRLHLELQGGVGI